MQNAFNISGSGMTANKTWLDITADNIANMNTTRTMNGGPYSRQSVTMTEKKSFENILKDSKGSGVEIASLHQDDRVRIVHDPSHPDANEDGYVAYPEINISAEMTNLLMAQRGYEANTTVFNTAKQLAEKTLTIGK